MPIATLSDADYVIFHGQINNQIKAISNSRMVIQAQLLSSKILPKESHDLRAKDAELSLKLAELINVGVLSLMHMPGIRQAIADVSAAINDTNNAILKIKKSVDQLSVINSLIDLVTTFLSPLQWGQLSAKSSALEAAISKVKPKI